jgi:hypothetical protein
MLDELILQQDVDSKVVRQHTTSVATLEWGSSWQNSYRLDLARSQV